LRWQQPARSPAVADSKTPDGGGALRDKTAFARFLEDVRGGANDSRPCGPVVVTHGSEVPLRHPGTLLCFRETHVLVEPWPVAPRTGSNGHKKVLQRRLPG